MSQQRISMAHGEGGELTSKLIKEIFIKEFGHSHNARFDSAVIKTGFRNMAVTTDSYVVKPLFFPGGDIGKLAVTGTVNDLAVSGALPSVLTAGFIIEEGFALRDLKKIVKSMAAEAEKAGVAIIAGDTKVVEKGSADGLFINTTGIGVFQGDSPLQSHFIEEGDAIIVSGTIGDHAIAILSARGEMGLLTEVESDCALINGLIQQLVEEIEGIRIMRDPTRGGLATALVELCEDFSFTAEIAEEALPVRRDVHGACDILGFDPLYLANEGKVLLVVDSKSKQKALRILQNNPLGKNASVIGYVSSTDDKTGRLLLKTPIGTTRRLHRLSGMLLPRIC